MCGRARCTLRPEDVRRACHRHGSTARFLHLEWFFSPFSPFFQFSFLFDCGSSQHCCFCRLYSYRPSYNVAPGSYMPVLRRDKDGVAVHCMKWGLVPGFTKKTDKPDFFKMVKTLLLGFCIGLVSLITVPRPIIFFAV